MNARRHCAMGFALLLGIAIAMPALAQKQGGILRVAYHNDPPSMSILEVGAMSVIVPMMGVFNNLVLFDQQVPQNHLHCHVFATLVQFLRE